MSEFCKNKHTEVQVISGTTKNFFSFQRKNDRIKIQHTYIL